MSSKKILAHGKEEKHFNFLENIYSIVVEMHLEIVWYLRSSKILFPFSLNAQMNTSLSVLMSNLNPLNTRNGLCKLKQGCESTSK